jgi:hypothetical protein
MYKILLQANYVPDLMPKVLNMMLYLKYIQERILQFQLVSELQFRLFENLLFQAHDHFPFLFNLMILKLNK